MVGTVVGTVVDVRTDSLVGRYDVVILSGGVNYPIPKVLIQNNVRIDRRDVVGDVNCPFPIFSILQKSAVRVFLHLDDGDDDVVVDFSDGSR